MNDYLWDKTGEPDAEVERLEELLGTLRHRERPLALPADASPSPRRTLRHFRAAYAAAAALALAALAGLWFGLSNNWRATSSPATLASNTTATGKTNQTETANQTESPGRLSETQNTPAVAAAAPREVERAAVSGRERGRHLTKGPSERSAARHRTRAAKSVERNLTASANRTPRRAAPRDAARAEQQLAVVPTSEQQAAKEQLMFALRLTSAKLGDVNRKASAPSAPRPAQEEPNKLR